jgi:hypothetical protein
MAAQSAAGGVSFLSGSAPLPSQKPADMTRAMSSSQAALEGAQTRMRGLSAAAAVPSRPPAPPVAMPADSTSRRLLPAELSVGIAGAGAGAGAAGRGQRSAALAAPAGSAFCTSES